MTSRAQRIDKRSANINEEIRKMKICKTLPVNRISKIVNNYTRRRRTKLIPQRGKANQLIEYTSFDESSEINHTQFSPIDEFLLNSMRASPPKAELSMNLEKTSLCEEILTLKKQLSSEKSRYSLLDKSYKELLELFTQNEIKYKMKIEELENKQRTIEELENKQKTIEKPEYVLREELNEIIQRINTLEENILPKKKDN